MAEERDRISIKCPNCDHPVVTLPEHYQLGGELICPGCGERLRRRRRILPDLGGQCTDNLARASPVPNRPISCLMSMLKK